MSTHQFKINQTHHLYIFLRKKLERSSQSLVRFKYLTVECPLHKFINAWDRHGQLGTLRNKSPPNASRFWPQKKSAISSFLCRGNINVVDGEMQLLACFIQSPSWTTPTLQINKIATTPTPLKLRYLTANLLEYSPDKFFFLKQPVFSVYYCFGILVKI